MNFGSMLASAGRNVAGGAGLFGQGGLVGTGASALGRGGAGGGLFGGDAPALIGAPGTPTAAAAQPGTGGLFSAAGASTHPGMTVGNVPTLTPDETKKLGFFGKLNAVDPTTGMSTTDKIGRFGAQLGDIWGDGDGSEEKGYNDRATAWKTNRKSTAASEAMNAQIDAMFGDDPKMRFLLKANPEKATEALLKAREPLKVGGEERLLDQSGREIAGQAPKYGVQNDAVFDERTGQFTGRAPLSYENQLGRDRLDQVEVPNMQTGRYNAQTGRMNAGTGAFAAHSADDRGRMTERRLAADGGGASGSGGGFGGGGQLTPAQAAQLRAMVFGGR